MTALIDLQRSFAAALSGDLRAHEATAAEILTDRIAPEARLAIYQSSVVNSLTDVMATTFPATARLLSPPAFDRLARRFVQQHPPAVPVLVRYGADFPNYLKHVGFPLAAAVAALEWARIEALHAAEAAPLGQAALAMIAQTNLAALVFTPHPSLRLLSADLPFVSHWLAYRPEGGGVCQATGPEAALILREVPLVAVSYLTGSMHGFLSTLANGRPLGEAVDHGEMLDPAFDPLTALHFAFDQGLFIAISA